MKTLIVHSIIAESQGDVNRHINLLRHCKRFQLDVMDGKFVNNVSCFFDFKLPKKYFFEAHLMVNDPIDWIKKYGSKVDLIIAPIESVKDFEKLKKLVKSKKKKLGLALNPETPVEKIKPYIKDLYQVLVLTVHPGKYGAEFLPEMLDKVRELRKLSKKLNIEVDGGMDLENVVKAKEAGANLIVAGSFVSNSDCPSLTFDELQKIVK